MKSEEKPKWGHPILTPDEDEIRLPYDAFPRLRRMGLLGKNRNKGLYQINDEIYQFFEPACDGLMDGLRQLLGYDMTGPDWLICHCRDCNRRREEADKTLPPEFQRKHANRSGFKPIGGRDF